MNVCAAAEQAGTAQRQRPAGRSAGRHHAAAVLRHLHGERLGRDADLQFLPVTCAASRGRADRLQLQALLLLGDDHPQHAVCRIKLGRERLLSGTDAGTDAPVVSSGIITVSLPTITYDFRDLPKVVPLTLTRNTCRVFIHLVRLRVSMLLVLPGWVASDVGVVESRVPDSLGKESFILIKHGSLRPRRETLAARWSATATSRASCRGGSDVHTHTFLASTPGSGTTSAGSRTSSKTSDNRQMKNKAQVVL